MTSTEEYSVLSCWLHLFKKNWISIKHKLQSHLHLYLFILYHIYILCSSYIHIYIYLYSYLQMAVLPVKENDILTKRITKTSVNSVLCWKHTKSDLQIKSHKNEKVGKQQKHLCVCVTWLHVAFTWCHTTYGSSVTCFFTCANVVLLKTVIDSPQKKLLAACRRDLTWTWNTLKNNLNKKKTYNTIHAETMNWWTLEAKGEDPSNSCSH